MAPTSKAIVQRAQHVELATIVEAVTAMFVAFPLFNSSIGLRIEAVLAPNLGI
jgi:hypothetical protein